MPSKNKIMQYEETPMQHPAYRPVVQSVPQSLQKHAKQPGQDPAQQKKGKMQQLVQPAVSQPVQQQGGASAPAAPSSSGTGWTENNVVNQFNWFGPDLPPLPQKANEMLLYGITQNQYDTAVMEGYWIDPESEVPDEDIEERIAQCNTQLTIAKFNQDALAKEFNAAPTQANADAYNIGQEHLDHLMVAKAGWDIKKQERDKGELAQVNEDLDEANREMRMFQTWASVGLVAMRAEELAGFTYKSLNEAMQAVKRLEAQRTELATAVYVTEYAVGQYAYMNGDELREEIQFLKKEGADTTLAQAAFDQWEANRMQGVKNQNQLDMAEEMLRMLDDGTLDTEGISTEGLRERLIAEIDRLEAGPLDYSRPEHFTMGVGSRMKAAIPVFLETSNQAAANRLAELEANPNLVVDETNAQALLDSAHFREQEFARQHGRLPNEEERAEIYASYNATKAPLDAIRVYTPVDMSLPGMQRLTEARMHSAKASEGLHPVGKFAVDAAGSIVQNLALMPLGLVSPSIPLFAMGAISAADKMYEVSAAGGSAQEAMGRGLVAGGIEILTEQIPLGEFLKLAKGAKAGAQSVVTSLLREAGFEFAEEGIAYGLNYLADTLAGDPNASFSVQELLYNMALGGFSGVFMGGMGVSMGHIGTRAVAAESPRAAPGGERAGPVAVPAGPHGAPGGQRAVAVGQTQQSVAFLPGSGLDGASDIAAGKAETSALAERRPAQNLRAAQATVTQATANVVSEHSQHAAENQPSSEGATNAKEKAARWLAEQAKRIGEVKQRYLGKVAETGSTAVSDKVGHDLSGYTITMDAAAADHATDTQAGATAEAGAGELPVTQASLSQVPDVLSAPDYVDVLATSKDESLTAFRVGRQIGGSEVVVDGIAGKDKVIEVVAIKVLDLGKRTAMAHAMKGNSNQTFEQGGGASGVVDTQAPSNQGGGSDSRPQQRGVFMPGSGLDGVVIEAESTALPQETNLDAAETWDYNDGEDEGAGKGTLTGSLDKLSQAERTMVDDLLPQGKNVEIVPRSNIQGVQTPDFKINGVSTELKTLTGTSLNTPVTRIQDAFNQGKNALIDARGNPNITATEVETIFKRIEGIYKNSIPGEIEIWTNDGIFRR